MEEFGFVPQAGGKSTCEVLMWGSSSEGVSTGVWCVPGFGAGFEFALEPSKLQKEGENPGKGHFKNLRQTLVCTKPWFKRDLTSCEMSCGNSYFARARSPNFLLFILQICLGIWK